MKIINQTRSSLVADSAVVAKSFFLRAKGLLGKKSFFSGQALIIEHCRAIHMFFMRFSIDVVFTDKNYVVVGVVENIKPFCVSPFFLKAAYAIELPAGTVSRSQTRLGDRIVLE